MTLRLFPFDHDHEVAGDALSALLGGKGAGLASMTQLGIPVPPGFTIPTTECLRYLADGWDEGLTEGVAQSLRIVEAAVDRRLGDPTAPLLVSVRSGAPISMPGMMDTVLNAGMTVEVAEGLARLGGDDAFAWDTFRRALASFTQVVLGATDSELLACGSAAVIDEQSARAFAGSLEAAGFVVPSDPLAQIVAAVEAVFRSWHSARAVTYRGHEGIDEGLGTAATVQAMVFGNLADRSGTGVAFSRDPSTGEKGLIGDFLERAQGEDVVAGTHATIALEEMSSAWPDCWEELVQVADRLEQHLADVVDLEFTVEDGRLWLLQTRRAKRSPRAVFRAAVDMANDPTFPVDRAEAVRRCEPFLDDPPVIPGDGNAPDVDVDVLATGLAASPGWATGVLSLDPDDAVVRAERGERVILIREETSPADVHGMAASVGLVTTLGGIVSHAAVVARSWGLAAVVGAVGIEFGEGALVSGGRTVRAGEVITVDGDSGRLLLGPQSVGTQPLPEVETIRAWARMTESSPDAPAGDAQSGEASSGEARVGGTVVPDQAASPEDCLRVVGLKGMVASEVVASILAAEASGVVSMLADLVDQELLSEMAGRVLPTPQGMERIDELYAQERETTQAAFDAILDRFHEPNVALKEIVTAWQRRPIDGTDVPNDHQDADYDASVVARLKAEVDDRAQSMLADVAMVLPRLGRYRRRLRHAVEQLDGGDGQYMAHPLQDSYHTVWFELHEELIRLAGRNRKDETEAGRA